MSRTKSFGRVFFPSLLGICFDGRARKYQEQKMEGDFQIVYTVCVWCVDASDPAV